MQISGDGALEASSTVPATLFVVLKDQSGNTIPPDDAAYGANTEAMMQLLDPEAESVVLPVSLAFSPDDQALVGEYTPSVIGTYLLQLSIGQTNASGRVNSASLNSSGSHVQVLGTFQIV